MEKRLKRLVFYYIVSGLFFIMLMSGSIVLKKYNESASNTLNKLHSVKANLMKMENAIKDMDAEISEIKKIIPHDFRMRTPEEFIFIGLDELKSKIKEAEIAVTNMEYKGEEVNLPVTIKAALKDYVSFVNNIGYLQSMRFPFFSISHISISKSQDKTQVLYEIKGNLRMLKKEQWLLE
jgi:hypothetical protein